MIHLWVTEKEFNLLLKSDNIVINTKSVDNYIMDFLVPGLSKLYIFNSLYNMSKFGWLWYHYIHTWVYRSLSIIFFNVSWYANYVWLVWNNIIYKGSNLLGSLIPIQLRHIAIHQYKLISFSLFISILNSLDSFQSIWC